MSLKGQRVVFKTSKPIFFVNDNVYLLLLEIVVLMIRN